MGKVGRIGKIGDGQVGWDGWEWGMLEDSETMRVRHGWQVEKLGDWDEVEIGR